ncbi:hypothetical protein M8J77_005854 [Diaphorina citri]|nr:hypothetical protein M8J77_005854 [Diaphorina citri]
MILCNTPSRYIIPHHAVLKQSSSTTKVRAVFNASASSSTQTSLNELLMKGPKLQKDISNIVLSFRSHCVVVCADIRQMYRQILLHPDDRKFQHIFWRNPDTNEVAEYELTTVTYGISPSAYQAQRVLQQLVHDEGESFPLASRAILNETYIDDIVSGAATQEEALQLQQELISLLKRGCFELRKWASNNAALLDNVPHDHREKPLALRDNEEPTFKILGLHWDPASDTFSYHVSDIDIVFTKRSILSHVARMFDPLGWLSPVIFWAKYLLQLLWLSQHSWDDPLSPAIAESWSTFSSQLPQLQTLRIPRYVDTSAPHSVHIVGFCDASSKGYAAVIYLVSSNINSLENKVYLLKGKSKVASTKSPLSIPRLELCGALLLARLYDSLKTYFSTLQISSRTFYSDSNIVLAWIKTPPHTLKTYVANRIVEVNNLISDKCDWYHVPTDLNPADCASRGLLPVQFLEHSQWLHGPDFLRLSSEHWPHTQGNLVETLPELKENTKSLLTVNPLSKSYLLQCCEKYSQLTKLQRVFAYVFRFINNVRSVREQRSLGTLSVSELDNSLMTITKLEQQYHFDKVISALQSNSKINNSAILKLTPFLDEHGRLRVGGRLRNAKNLSQDSTHPLLLAKHCHLSKLLCDHYHMSSLHAGPRTVQALLQQKFWIMPVRDLLRQRIFKCMRCYRFPPKPGALILLPKANHLPLHWPLGRIIDVYPGNDNVTRCHPFVNNSPSSGAPHLYLYAGRQVITLKRATEKYKIAFANEALWKILRTQLTSILNIPRAERTEEKNLVAERIIILIRNVLQIPTDPETERCCHDNPNSHDTVVYVLNQAGMLDILIYIAMSPDESNYYLHLLEWNAGGLTLAKRINLEQLIKTHNIDVFCIMEANLEKSRNKSAHPFQSQRSGKRQ